MYTLPRVYSDQRPIVAGLKRATKALKKDVVRIVYKLGEDWVGQPSIFINVILNDEAAADDYKHLGAVAGRVREKISKEVDAYEMGLNPYIAFRTLSEQAELQDPNWE